MAFRVMPLEDADDINMRAFTPLVLFMACLAFITQPNIAGPLTAAFIISVIMMKRMSDYLFRILMRDIAHAPRFHLRFI